MKIKFAWIALLIFMISCNDTTPSSTPPENNDLVKEPNKNGSIETVVSVKHDSLYDLLTTTHKVWVKGSVQKTLVKVDTLQSLGDTLRQDDKGNKKSMKKDYEFYITVQ